MKVQRTLLAGLAFACSLSLGSALTVQAQDQTTTTKETTTTTSYDSSNWQAPVGYAEAYPENGTPNMVARQGYSAGFTEGQADASKGKKFTPTENRAYAKAVIPQGIDKNDFRQQFREAFVKGYSHGYKGDTH